MDLLDTLALFAGRSLSEESELEADDSDELLSAFRLRLLVVTDWVFCFTDVVVGFNLEVLSLSSSASLSEEEEDEDGGGGRGRGRGGDEEDEDEDDDEDDEEEEDEAARFAARLFFTFFVGFLFFTRSALDESSVLLPLPAARAGRLLGLVGRIRLERGLFVIFLTSCGGITTVVP